MANGINPLQLATTLGTWITVGYLVSWLLPKFQKPVVAVPAASAVTHPAMTTVANSPTAATLSGGVPRDFNLSGLAIEDLEDYPSSSGVSLSGI